MYCSAKHLYIYIYIYMSTLPAVSPPVNVKPHRPVPLLQWRSAGVLHLMDLLPSLLTGSSMAMERVH